MSEIVVLRPDEPSAAAATLELAPRVPLPERPVIGLVANGKPLAAELLEVLAAELAALLGRPVDTLLVRKPSAAYPITEDEATMLAARAHVVVAGLGD